MMSKVNIFQQFSKKSRKTKNMTEKREFLRKTSFRPNRVFLYGCNSKTDHCEYLKFSPNVYVSVINIHSSFYETFKITKICISGVFRPLKHKPPLSPTIRNDPRLTNHLR
ncbi:hypothetical protein FWK35_00030070 [Aphis craccivora]|uniref:Uncharacterized protein n=1 Tax=Aphis craccivora TaxID=307492 RepID=A0A6G0YT59_APHCR|nr:hypothetical protein FWK35_00030070 [Aphis craccivora]